MEGFKRGPPRRMDGPREEHKAICAACGNECTVPFEPTPGRDVFCQNCFKSRRQR